MTVALSGSEIAEILNGKFAEGIVEACQDSLVVDSEFLPAIAPFLKDTPGLDFDYLNYITGIDYQKYFELVYHLVSIKHNRSLKIKTRCYQRDEPIVPSLVNIWQGADFQEREIFDLLGIRFNGHPNMKRIFLWDGFKGHPLRKDFNDGT